MNLKHSETSDSEESVKVEDPFVNNPNKSPMVVKVERKIVFGSKKNSMHVIKKVYKEDSNDL